ncbi:DUF6053 domain-containing protein [Lysobacter enzymogenes]|uniref:DUF6053 domain-containing protein n=1 Tax=Lysobacter enzymogenes TaxID=69 RepID=UPI00384FFC37
MWEGAAGGTSVPTLFGPIAATGANSVGTEVPPTNAVASTKTNLCATQEFLCRKRTRPERATASAIALLHQLLGLDRKQLPAAVELLVRQPGVARFATAARIAGRQAEIDFDIGAVAAAVGQFDAFEPGLGRNRAGGLQGREVFADLPVRHGRGAGGQRRRGQQGGGEAGEAAQGAGGTTVHVGGGAGGLLGRGSGDDSRCPPRTQAPKRTKSTALKRERVRASKTATA